MAFAQRRNGLTSRFSECIPVVKWRMTILNVRTKVLQNSTYVPGSFVSVDILSTVPNTHLGTQHKQATPRCLIPHVTRLQKLNMPLVYGSGATPALHTHTIHELKPGRSQSDMLRGREINWQSHFKEFQTLKTRAGRKSVASSSSCPICFPLRVFTSHFFVFVLNDVYQQCTERTLTRT